MPQSGVPRAHLVISANWRLFLGGEDHVRHLSAMIGGINVVASRTAVVRHMAIERESDGGRIAKARSVWRGRYRFLGARSSYTQPRFLQASATRETATR